MYLQSKFLTSEIITSTLVYLAIQIYNYVDSTDEDGILIESAVYAAVRNVGIPIDQLLLESIIANCRNQLQKGKVC